MITEHSFDVLTYPRGGETKKIIVDAAVDTVDTTIENEQPVVFRRNLSRIALQSANDHAELAQAVGSNPHEVTLVTDQSIGRAALEQGMGGVEAHQSEGVQDSLNLLLHHNRYTEEKFYDKFPLYADLSYEEIVETLFRSDEIHIVGFVGRTGAGKSTSIRRMVDTLQHMGMEGDLFQVDSFFKLSRNERRAWLNERGIADEERAERKRVASWWDFETTIKTLDAIRDGEPIHLSDLYDMEQGGEKVGTMDITPNPNGHVIFVEGTALLLPELSRAIDSFVYINAHDQVREQSLMERNLRHGYTQEESVVRKALTDAAETGDHISYPLRASRFQESHLTVLDNSARSNTLKLMPPYIPKY